MLPCDRKAKPGVGRIFPLMTSRHSSVYIKESLKSRMTIDVDICTPELSHNRDYCEQGPVPWSVARQLSSRTRVQASTRRFRQLGNWQIGEPQPGCSPEVAEWLKATGPKSRYTCQNLYP